MIPLFHFSLYIKAVVTDINCVIICWIQDSMKKICLLVFSSRKRNRKYSLYRNLSWYLLHFTKLVIKMWILWYMYIYGVLVGHKNIFFKDICAHEMLIFAENLSPVVSIVLWHKESLHLLIYSGSREESKYTLYSWKQNGYIMD